MGFERQGLLRRCGTAALILGATIIKHAIGVRCHNNERLGGAAGPSLAQWRRHEYNRHWRTVTLGTNASRY